MQVKVSNQSSLMAATKAASVSSSTTNFAITLNSNINASVDLAMNALENDPRVILIGCGNAIGKTITIAEILKRNDSDLKQENRLVKEIILEKKNNGSKKSQEGGKVPNKDGDDDEEGRVDDWKENKTERFLPKLEITLFKEDQGESTEQDGDPN